MKIDHCPDIRRIDAPSAQPRYEVVVLDRLPEAELEIGLGLGDDQTRRLVIGQGPNLALRSDARVFFHAPPEISSAALADLLVGSDPEAGGRGLAEVEALEVDELESILDAVGRLAASRDLAAGAACARGALTELLGADRADCLFHDGEAGLLWSDEPVVREQDTRAGLAGFVAKTGRLVTVERVEDAPCYERALDDPEGRGRERLLVAPIHGAEGVEVVVVAAREGHRPAFSAEDRRVAELFCARVGPMIEHLALREEARAIQREREEQTRGPFRIEALRERKKLMRHGDVVRVVPGWVAAAYWCVVAAIGLGLVYLALGRVSVYSSGPAIVRLHQRTEVGARAPGALAEVFVGEGEAVEAGELLARLEDEAQRRELEHSQAAWREQLRGRLLAPNDLAAGAALVAVRQQLRAASDALAERELRAPVDGVVGELRIRPGQHVAPGAVVMSVLGRSEDRRVVALLPGADSPRLEPGMTMRLELAGYRDADRELIVTEVSDEVIGPNEARRFLGPALSDAIAAQGSVVLVEAALPDTEFSVDGVDYRYHEGMPARAEVRVRSSSLLELLIPGLEGMLRG